MTVVVRSVDAGGGQSWFGVPDWAAARALLAAMLWEARTAGARLRRLRRGPGLAFEADLAGDVVRMRAYRPRARKITAKTLAVIETLGQPH